MLRICTSDKISFSLFTLFLKWHTPIFWAVFKNWIIQKREYCIVHIYLCTKFDISSLSRVISLLCLTMLQLLCTLSSQFLYVQLYKNWIKHRSYIVGLLVGQGRLEAFQGGQVNGSPTGWSTVRWLA